MNAVGIDVSKGKSMVAALRPFGEVALLPREFVHSAIGLEQLTLTILELGEDTRVILEATGRYHEPIAAALYESGIYVSILNPIRIHKSGGGSVRKVKSDKKDALKIAKYGLGNWINLREHTPMDTVRQQLKLFSRQYNLHMKMVVALQNNLIASAAGELTASATILATVRTEVIRLAKLLPEYETVLSIYGVGEITGAQLMAEIGDVYRFANHASLIAFAGIDPAVN